MNAFDDRTRLAACVLMMSLISCACSGSGGSGSDPAVGTPVAPPAPAPPPAPATACDTATGRKLTVGPGKTYPVPSAAAAAAADGDVVLISAGDFIGDVATWPQSNLTICGAGGRARLFAGGNNARGKGIWVVQGANVVIDGLEFHNATVPDQNGAGIRAEGDGLAIRNSGFFDNENGILGPNDGDITIDSSEFARNGRGDGYTHNIYVGYANRLVVTNSYFHEAKIGHNLKSRAKETRIENSYFMDGPTGTASYEVDVPNGGLVSLRGNLFHKGPRADNATLVSYGSEGLLGGRTDRLTMTHNTLVSTYPGGAFVYANPGVVSVTLTANLLAGTNNPALFNGDVAGKVVQANNLVSSAAKFSAADNIGNPSFWPSADLVAQALLAAGVVPDAGYVIDAPRPFVLRSITARQRVIGALQAPP